MATLPDCPVRWLKYGNPKTGQPKKSGEKWTSFIFALDPAATSRVRPCSYFLPHVFRFRLDFAPVVRITCERKFGKILVWHTAVFGAIFFAKWRQKAMFQKMTPWTKTKKNRP
ncbi:hypothetical protein TNCV_1117231 [Trichonephila clavipes]|nr:hypothetical protein TNCV_1117231 [Trichonephila clavipes]